MIPRKEELARLKSLVCDYPVTAILGARQVGKTTLAHTFASHRLGPSTFFDLENPEHLFRLSDPMLALEGLKGLVVIDEVQRLPGLFRVLRVLADRPRLPARFLILGSASPDLLRQSSESLAGRIAYHELKGFYLDEVGMVNRGRLWFRGGFPKSYLAMSLSKSHEWRRYFIQTYLERDLPQLGFTVSSVTLHRFWSMVAHRHGQIWNASDIGRSFGIADTTVRRYLDILTSTFVVRQLLPWHENISKRQVKSPKMYVADTGLLHALLNIKTPGELEGHPQIGSSWEGFVIEQILRVYGAAREECFFWATHAGAELDLLIVKGRKRHGFEIKRTVSPGITASARSAVDTLRLESLDIIHMGKESFPMGKRIRAVAFEKLPGVSHSIAAGMMA